MRMSWSLCRRCARAVVPPIFSCFLGAGSCSDEAPGGPTAPPRESQGIQCLSADFPPRPRSDCVIPPQPPTSCDLPDGGIRVRDAAELRDALAHDSAQDIILADGVYNDDSTFVPAAPHRLWGETLGGAVLRTGILFRKGYGPEVHCLTFDVDDVSRGGSEESIISTRGSADGLRVTDSFFDGHGKMRRGVITRAFHGVHLQRLVMKNFQNDAIRITTGRKGLSDQQRIARPPVYIGDVDIAHVRDLDPECCTGRSEFGITLLTIGLVERIKVRDTDWSCILTAGRSWGSVLRDLDLNGCRGAGVYLEHRTAYTTVEYFRIGPDARSGFSLEGGQPQWNIDDPRWNWKAIGPGNVIKHGTIDSRAWGVNVAPCNAETTVQNVAFLNQCVTGILNGAAVRSQSCPAPRPGGGTSADSNIYRNNDFSGIGPNAVPILDEGWRAARKKCIDRSYPRRPLPIASNPGSNLLSVCARPLDLSSTAHRQSQPERERFERATERCREHERERSKDRLGDG
jgi:hypothetical protein